MKYWILKSEPGVYSVDDLAGCNKKTDHWDGIRNYEARNSIRDEMSKGDLAFFYHSNCKEPGIVGIVEIVREAYPDTTAFDPGHDHYDPKSDAKNPRWFMVDVRLRRKLQQTITLAELKKHKALEDMRLLQRGNRLSIIPVTEAQWNYIIDLVDN